MFLMEDFFYGFIYKKNFIYFNYSPYSTLYVQ